jgi:hypothetical protein
VLDVLVAEVGLQRPGVVPFVGQRVAAPAIRILDLLKGAPIPTMVFASVVRPSLVGKIDNLL